MRPEHVEKYGRADTETNASGTGDCGKDGSTGALRSQKTAGRPQEDKLLGQGKQARFGQGFHSESECRTAITSVEQSLRSASKPKNDNIYYSNSYVLAAVTIDRNALIFFEGLGWCLDLAIAKKFATLGKATADSEREPPTHHPLEVWKIEGETLKLAVHSNERRDTLPRVFQLREIAA